MPFFNANPESEDLQLLPASFAQDEELPFIAGEAEAAVLGAFTVVIPSAPRYGQVGVPVVSLVPTGAYALDATNGIYVCLRGFDPVPASCAAALAAALKREIASVIRWTRDRWRANPHLASESSGQGEKAVSYRDDANTLFPPSFGQYLRPYDIRPPAIVI